MEHEKSPYNFARDGFLYLISYFTLAVFAMGLNFLIKALINKVVPDSADVGDFMANPEFIVGLLPAVLIAFPIFLWVSTYANKMLGKGDMRHDTGVRRWLIYLTMVVVIVTILMQLIFLLMSYLNGSAGERFLWHTLVTLAIASGILWYEWWQLKFFDGKDNKKLDWKFRVFEWKTVVIVIASLVLGFVIIGSPAQRRAEKLDDIRVQRISQIRSSINDYYGYPAYQGAPAFGHLRLPKDYTELRADNRNYLDQATLKDPVTEKEFEYKILSDTRFSLCGEFATESKPDDKSWSIVVGMIDDYTHPAGPHCFEFTVIGAEPIK